MNYYEGLKHYIFTIIFDKKLMFAEEMTTKPKHILFLPRWYPHRFDAMFGLFVKKHAEAVSLYNKVTIIYVQGVSSLLGFPKKEVISVPNLITYIYYYQNSKCRIWNSLRFWYYQIFGFLTLYKEKGLPDIIHVHILTRLGVFAYVLNFIFRTPYFITEHWSRYLVIPGTYKGWLRKKLGQIVVKNAKAILPISLNLAHAMQEHKLFNTNYQLVPNVVDDLFFQSKQTKNVNSKTVFLHVSTFDDYSKNISGILRSIKQLSEKTIDFEFWFVGDGMDFEKMKKYADSLSIPEPLICFFGLKQKEELVELYSQSDFMLIFSNFENIPVVINEALACGLPIIATKVGGITEYINESNGILINPGNEKQLVDTLYKVIYNPPKFDNETIRQTALQFSYQAVGKLINRIYNDSIIN